MVFFVEMSGQKHAITMKVQLDDNKDILRIDQRIIYYNNSNTALKEIPLHNWANSYKDNRAPLAKRLIEDYDKSLYFATEKDRGFTKIYSLAIDSVEGTFSTFESDQIDIVKIILNRPLEAKKSVAIDIVYDVKIPNAKFTGYGKTKTGYHLRYWYLIPAVFKDNWKIMSNLNMDDLMTNISDYSIIIEFPKYFSLCSNLNDHKVSESVVNEYLLTGHEKTEAILSIDTNGSFKTLKTENIEIKTDLYNPTIDEKLTIDILSRQLLFIKRFLGSYPHKELFVDKASQAKNPIYGLNQLPRFIRPFPDVFEWELTMLKAMTKRFIGNTLLTDTRKDYWLTDGLQMYLMIRYVSEYYPEIKLTGNISKIWGFKNFNFSTLNFNDKYPFVYQYSTRQFLDQALTVRSDSLSNFNRKISGKYKASLGLRYLGDYLGDSVLVASIKDFYQKNALKYSKSDDFKKIVSSKTTKDIDWFFGDYLKTDKKIDYTIKKAVAEDDSVYVTIKNKRNFTAPVALYGLKNKSVKFKKWLTNIDDIQTVGIPKNGFDRVSLNFDNSYPELNSMDNWRKVGKNILNKPIQLKFYKDINDPYYHQLYLQPNIKYNFYDGTLLGLRIHNKPILARNFQFSITPQFGTKSSSFNGTFDTRYTQYFENSRVNKVFYSLSGSNLHYAEGLSYNTFNQNITLQFRRKSLRDVGGSFLSARLLNINRELTETHSQTTSDRYRIFKLKYYYNKPDIIKGFQYSFGTEIASNYSKVTGEVRFRKLTAKNTQLDFRFYTGSFLNNTTESDFFSFGLDKANDYLFELNYIGRSESTGVFSQQFIMAEGGFKSVLDQRFANEFLISFNSSVGIWKWIEIYNDIAFLKNKSKNVFFAYENGMRFNFIHNILEFYFPLYSNNGWEINKNAYPKNIRFVLVANPTAIFNFFRRGFI